ncbi:MAG TPA: ATP-binding protein [Ilumatobacter sp.]|nr:ATP-binding protein [Ilumatobacter sp.]
MTLELLTQRRRDAFDARLDARLDVGDLYEQVIAAGDPVLTLQTEITLALFHMIRSDLVESKRYATSALAGIADFDPSDWAESERQLVGVLYNTLGNLALCSGDFMAARHWYVIALRDNVDAALPFAASMNWINIGLSELCMGNLANAADYNSRILGWPVERHRAVGSARVGLARVAICEGRHEEAATLLAGVRGDPEQSRLWDLQFIINGRLRAAVQRVDAEAGIALAEAVISSPVPLMPELVLQSARAVLNTGDPARARAILLDDARMSGPEHGWIASGTAACLAACAIAEGALDTADEILTGADVSRSGFEDRLAFDQQRESLAVARGDFEAAFKILSERINLVAGARRVAAVPELDVGAVPVVNVADAGTSELERAFERLRLANLEEMYRQRRELLGIVAHDLRGPLMNVRVSLEMIAAIGPSEADQQRELATATSAIGRSVDSMRSVVDVLAVLAEVDDWTMGGIKALKASPSDPQHVGALAQAVVAESAPWARRHRQTIHVYDNTSADSILDGDPRVFRIVLANLLSNAIKYSPDGVDIDVRIDHVDDAVGIPWVRVEVEDHGPGMAPEFVETVWGRFVRADSVVRPGQPSLGLGLYIARVLTQRAHGKLSVWSEVGAGSTFRLDLPIRALVSSA